MELQDARETLAHIGPVVLELALERYTTTTHPREFMDGFYRSMVEDYYVTPEYAARIVEAFLVVARTRAH